MNMKPYVAGVLIVFALMAVIALAGCAPGYYEEYNPGYPRAYDERVVHDRNGDAWYRCWIKGRPAWCRVDD